MPPWMTLHPASLTKKDQFKKLRGSRASSHQTLSEFFESIQYTGPWELATMVWCFCGDRTLDTISAQEVLQEVPKLKRRRVVTKKELTQNQTPANLIMNYFQGRGGE